MFSRHLDPHKSRATIVETDVPARLDALPWGRFHTLVVVALGITWILDGLEVTLAGGRRRAQRTRRFGPCRSRNRNGKQRLSRRSRFGHALFFGWLTDRLGRRRLFFITLAVYLSATAATAASWNATSFVVFRFCVGCGIGGEYSAVNSTIQELIPARMRGWTDLVINGSFWIGAATGAAGSLLLLDPAVVDPAIGWRSAFMIGAVLGLVILLMRRWIPESPRWLMFHGRTQEADDIVAAIESQFALNGDTIARRVYPRVKLRARPHTPFVEIAQTLFRNYPRRTLVAVSLMAS
jgi:MFS family permease